MMPPVPPFIKRIVAQIIFLGLRDQNLRLLRQARHVRKARRPAARTPAYEALLCLPMDGLRADVASPALRVRRTFLYRDRDELLVLFVGIELFRAAATLNLLTKGLVAFPVPRLAFPAAVAELADRASKALDFEGGSARGAFGEDHVIRHPKRASFLPRYRHTRFHSCEAMMYSAHA